MNRWLFGAAVASALLSGCATVDRGSIPVIESSGSVFDEQEGRGAAVAARPPVTPTPQPAPAEDSGVVVMVPGGGGSAPIQTYPAPSATISTAPISSSAGGTPSGGYVPSAPTGIPRSGAVSGSGLAADEQLDGPILALLTTARQEQNSGNLESAASSLERAQRIAPREPQVLYRLAEVRLAQGDAAQAEQLARRALTYASGRPALQASLWNLIAQARERQGDPAGAAQARERARVNL